MNRRKLGPFDVSALGFGCMSLSHAYGTPPAPEDAAKALHAALDAARLASFPEGYRHLGYLQSKVGFTVKTGLPGLRGAAVETLYAEGAAWLAGSATPGVPL